MWIATSIGCATPLSRCICLLLFACSVSMMQQQERHKALVSLKNLTAERYWEARWQREWETKYHDPVLVSLESCRAPTSQQDPYNKFEKTGGLA